MAAAGMPSVPLPRLSSNLTTAERTALQPVPGVLAPQLDATSRAITSIHDHRHTVADQSNPAPTFNSRGQAHLPGKGSGLRITSEQSGPLAFTATGSLPPADPFDRTSPRVHRTRTELLAARRSAARAPDTYDLGGDGVVDQREYFYATKFDANGDGTLDQGERETAAALMKNAATKLVFIPPRGVKFHRNTFSRYSQAVVPGHSVLQVKGAILSEQLEGHATLARSRMPGGGGASGALGDKGAHLPPEVAEKVGELLLTGTAGVTRGGQGVEVDLDASDNVVALHLAGARTDFDRVEIKPNYRPELHASGSKLRSELLAARKAARAPALSYDVDGDGQVSARDFFFSARQDRTGRLALDAAARERAAVEEAGGGLGKYFTEIRGDGAGLVGHRVQQRDGAVLGENSAGGWAALTHSRMHGTNVRIGLDGNLKYVGEGGEPELSAGELDKQTASLLDDRDGAGMTMGGRVALGTVAGAVTDYDAVTVKPHYRPHLLASGAQSVRELKLHRARDKRPDASFDLSGNGGAAAVSMEDYQLSKRFDAGDKGYLTADEAAAAQAALAGGLREQFTRLSTGSSRALSTRTFQRADGSIENQGADVGAAAAAEPPYDATQRLPTQGIVPGLDLPAEIAAGTGKPAGARDADAHGSAGSGAMTYNASLKGAEQGKLFVSMSCGAVPGVARAVVRYPDGRQEAYGGYAGGVAAGGVSNVTAPRPVEVSPGTHREALGERTTRGATAFEMELGNSSSSSSSSSTSLRKRPVSMDASAHATTSWHSPRPTQQQLTLRPSPNVNPEAPFRTHNQTTYCDPEDRGSVHAQAPFALAGVGGTNDGVAAWSEVMEAQRTAAPQLGLRTATQLKAARKARDHDAGAAAAVQHSLPPALAHATLTAAGRPSDAALAPAIAAAAALPGNSLALTQAAAWLAASSTVASAASLAAAGGAPVQDAAGAGLFATATMPPNALNATLLPAHGSTLKDERDARALLPSGSPVVLDRTGRGCYTGGLDGLSTSVALAAMPPLHYTHLPAAAAVAQGIALTTPGSPLRPATAPPTAAALPAYMARTLSSASMLNVDAAELSSDHIKPGALDESVRHLEAPTRSALKALRKRDALLAARADYEAREDVGGGAGPTPALPQLHTVHYNDSTVASAGHSASLLSIGAGEGSSSSSSSGGPLDAAAPLSKTQSALKQRLRARQITEALPGAPTGPASIHPAPLPSFAARLSHSLTPWYQDRAAASVPLDAGAALEDLQPSRGVAGGFPAYTSIASALDGPAPPEDAVLAALPGNYHGIAKEYDAALRHTVRAPELCGQAASSAAQLAVTQGARVTLSPAAQGARNPRLIVDGLAREEECVGAGGGGFDKVREVRPCDLGPWVRRREESIALKVTEVDPAAPSAAAAASASNVSVPQGSPAGGGGSAFVSRASPTPSSPATGAQAQGPQPRLYELHPNVSSLGTGLPGAPPWHGEATLRTALMDNPFRLNSGTGNWANAQLEHAHRIAGEAPHTLDGEGKAPVSPRDIRPLYSSFSSDKAFMLPYVTPRGLPLQPRSPSRVQLSAAVAMAGGSVRPGVGITAFRAMPSQGVPGPENPRPLRAALPHDLEGRRGSTYGVEVVEGGAGGGRDVSVRGATQDRWGEGGLSARTLRAAEESAGAAGSSARAAASPRAGGAQGAAQAAEGGGSYAGVRTGGFRD